MERLITVKFWSHCEYKMRPSLWIHFRRLHMTCCFKNNWASRNSLCFKCRRKKIMWHFKSVEIFCSRRRAHAKNRKGRKWTFHRTLDNKQYSCLLFLKAIIRLKTFQGLFYDQLKKDVQSAWILIWIWKYLFLDQKGDQSHATGIQIDSLQSVFNVNLENDRSQSLF